MDEPRTGLCRGLCLFFMILQNLLISNLPGAKMATFWATLEKLETNVLITKL